MKQVNPNVFDSNASDYDNWFDRHPLLFQSECKAIGKTIPVQGIGVEIGVGTGRFAELLKIPVGVEPVHAMAQMAIGRGVTVVKAKAENLPFHSLSFDYALMATTVCFLDDIPKAFAEAHRIIKKNGYFIVAMIDRDSAIGIEYEAKKAASPWYKNAHFYSVHEITDLMQQAGFALFEYWQTLFDNREELTDPLPGFGKGSFVVIRSQKM
jgi:ubiquinone/menaquinone biosynthesis C-methylase UbiE